MTSASGSLTHITFRISKASRSELDHRVESSQRTLAQLVRNAIELYLSTPPNFDASKLEDAKSLDSEYSVHVGVRLPSDILSALEARVVSENRSLSQVMRNAVELWLSQVNPEQLGGLAVLGSE